MVQALAMAQTHVLHMAQPVIDQANASTSGGGDHTTTTVMPHHHDVLDPQMLDSKLNHRQGIQVGGNHHVGHIAMHEHLARVQAHNFIGGDSAVRTPNPQVFGRLLFRQFFKKIWSLFGHTVCPFAVVGEKTVEGVRHSQGRSFGKNRWG